MKKIGNGARSSRMEYDEKVLGDCVVRTYAVGDEIPIRDVAGALVMELGKDGRVYGNITFGDHIDEVDIAMAMDGISERLLDEMDARAWREAGGEDEDAEDDLEDGAENDGEDGRVGDECADVRFDLSGVIEGALFLRKVIDI